MATVRLDERKLEDLKRQLFGKEVIPIKINNPKIQPALTSHSETALFKFDMLKILILSVLAIGGQMLVYLASNKQIMNLHLNF